jgi:hypothetical protein
LLNRSYNMAAFLRFSCLIPMWLIILCGCFTDLAFAQCDTNYAHGDTLYSFVCKNGYLQYRNKWIRGRDNDNYDFIQLNRQGDTVEVRYADTWKDSAFLMSSDHRGKWVFNSSASDGTTWFDSKKYNRQNELTEWRYKQSGESFVVIHRYKAGKPPGIDTLPYPRKPKVCMLQKMDTVIFRDPWLTSDIASGYLKDRATGKLVKDAELYRDSLIEACTKQASRIHYFIYEDAYGTPFSRGIYRRKGHQRYTGFMQYRPTDTVSFHNPYLEMAFDSSYATHFQETYARFSEIKEPDSLIQALEKTSSRRYYAYEHETFKGILAHEGMYRKGHIPVGKHIYYYWPNFAEGYQAKHMQGWYDRRGRRHGIWTFYNPDRTYYLKAFYRHGRLQQ